MSRIFVSGDVHGFLDINKIVNFKDKYKNQLSKNDYLIIAGDFGLLWENNLSNSEIKLSNFYTSAQWTTLVVPGNHENYNRIFSMSITNMFGGKVRVYNDSIIFLERGETYIIGGKKFWVMGGGLSIDKKWRTPNLSWWVQEQPNYNELNHGIETLAENNGSIDYIITHVAPQSILNDIFSDVSNHPKYYDPLSKYLDEILNDYAKKYKWWYCGHYHKDIDITNKKISVLYNEIKELNS